MLPIFPLPDLTFFPGTLLPLHVFEARYRAMIVDALARDRRLCVVKLKPGYEPTYAEKPAVHEIAGAGEIVNWERLPTGRYNVVVRGEWRVRIERELPSDTLYRLVRAKRLEEPAPTADVSGTLERVRAACGRLLRVLNRPSDLLDGALADGLAPGLIADRVASAVLPDAMLRQELLETLDGARRLERLAQALEALVDELRGARGDAG